MDDMQNKSEEYWKEKLTPKQYKVMRLSATEPPFTGEYYATFDNGVYKCAGCGETLFSSDTKYDAGCGWPSFWNAIGDGKLELKDDNSFGMHRIEVLCSKCGGHLGHLFDDGPGDKGGKRYCINSTSLNFEKK
ncbi:peptide-methionine (R)-S-oxide reductase [candidate division WWE3 bacterium RIFCSPHIGHO2_01_FULL_40_23]|uniref:peptide-methionine (R)-S-oxide reductase n=1 Tax=candidate division WWE3 bacterium RIFCSPLOWO2_01_FULL_41_18 TaxID=1802625 RepID=A0A1F4VGL4_UNCKA|nr:MAG: peptide-methionine (R)-S-oxide reductase [candidate division WWE3 bacterium RIFCSPHIGHO2_01_FULL_40_23]OGC55873.1 MAG: peptide-methionine (R)-S-oxide reductase [candidate division WWE3 bacterium RIFCSPLOWO2_01_FULL_41_18]